MISEMINVSWLTDTYFSNSIEIFKMAYAIVETLILKQQASNVDLFGSVLYLLCASEEHELHTHVPRVVAALQFVYK